MVTISFENFWHTFDRLYEGGNYNEVTRMQIDNHIRPNWHTSNYESTSDTGARYLETFRMQYELHRVEQLRREREEQEENFIQGTDQALRVNLPAFTPGPLNYIVGDAHVGTTVRNITDENVYWRPVNDTIDPPVWRDPFPITEQDYADARDITEYLRAALKEDSANVRDIGTTAEKEPVELSKEVWAF